MQTYDLGDVICANLLFEQTLNSSCLKPHSLSSRAEILKKMVINYLNEKYYIQIPLSLSRESQSSDIINIYYNMTKNVNCYLYFCLFYLYNIK